MAFPNKFSVLLAGCLLSCSVFAAQVDVGGIKLQDAAEIAGTKLPLNGAGVRYKAVFKVYAAALYVGKKASTAEEFFNAPGPKRLSLTMLRDVDANELGRAFIKGFEDNTPKAEMGKVLAGLARMGQVFADQKKLVAGDNLTIDFIPGTGTLITIKDKLQGEPFREAEFFNALMRIWLGPNPADYRLKDALLGALSKPAS